MRLTCASPALLLHFGFIQSQMHITLRDTKLFHSHTPSSSSQLQARALKETVASMVGRRDFTCRTAGARIWSARNLFIYALAFCALHWKKAKSGSSICFRQTHTKKKEKEKKKKTSWGFQKQSFGKLDLASALVLKVTVDVLERRLLCAAGSHSFLCRAVTQRTKMLTRPNKRVVQSFMSRGKRLSRSSA